MPKINLLYVITKLELGGAQKQLLSLINNLDQGKFNVYLFTAKEGRLIPQDLLIDGLTLKRSEFLERLINPLKDVLALAEIYCFIKKNRIQIVHTHSSKAGILGRLAAKLAQVPVIIHTVHGWSFHDYQPSMVYNFYLFLERICATFTNRIIVVSNYDKKNGLNNSVGQARQYVLIRYGINRDEFKGQEKRALARASLGLSDGDLVVGMVACFKPQKAPLDFIKLAGAMKNDFPNIKFILVGDGVLRRKICALIEKLNLKQQVVLAGWRKDLPLILSCLDVFVLTSLWEGLPIVVLEAMAAGVPWVATDTGGIREVAVNEKTGCLVKAHDIQSMRSQIKELLTDVSKRQEFSRLSRERIGAEEFLSSSLLRRTEEIYFNLLPGGQNA